jgi:hypothetical protein
MQFVGAYQRQAVGPASTIRILSMAMGTRGQLLLRTTLRSMSAEATTAGTAGKLDSSKDSKSENGPMHFRRTNTPHPLNMCEESVTKKAHLPYARELDDKKPIPWLMEHAIWTPEETKSVKITHRPPSDLSDRAALGAVKFLRFAFDWLGKHFWIRLQISFSS